MPQTTLAAGPATADWTDCRQQMERARSRLHSLDACLFAGDLDGAADAVRDAWRRHLIPIEYLCTRFDGEFWESWPSREVVVANLQRARSALVDAGPGDLDRVLRRMADLIESNLWQLDEALRLLNADSSLSA